jgi:hypothetical protein
MSETRIQLFLLVGLGGEAQDVLQSDLFASIREFNDVLRHHFLDDLRANTSNVFGIAERNDLLSREACGQLILSCFGFASARHSRLHYFRGIAVYDHASNFCENGSAAAKCPEI